MKNNLLGEDFWASWVKADEMERLRLVEKLPVFQNDGGGLCMSCGMSSTIINSYFEDLLAFTEKLKLKTKKGGSIRPLHS